MTIEDPISSSFATKRSIVNQREVGVDTMSFLQALKERAAAGPGRHPRGREIEITRPSKLALHAAETGHLVVPRCTLDATGR